MLPEKLQALLQLASRTGDRLIIWDASTGQDFVLMDLSSYQKLLGGLGSFNQNNLANNSDKIVEKPIIEPESSPVKENLTEEDLTDKINREISLWKNGTDRHYAAEEDSPRKAWQIPTQVKDKAREIEA